MPVEHINGKVARQAQKVKNAYNSLPSDNAFYYGYQLRGRLQSRFGVREIPRNLNDNPYTVNEQVNKADFKFSVELAIDILNNESQKIKALSDFKSQRKYIRLFNYIIARIRLNNGDIPPEWL